MVSFAEIGVLCSAFREPGCRPERHLNATPTSSLKSSQSTSGIWCRSWHAT